MLRRKKSLETDDLNVRGEKVGRDIFKDNEKLCSTIYTQAQKMGEDVALGRLYYYCAALLFVTSNLSATIELEKKGINSTQEFFEASFTGFMRLHKEKNEISREQFDKALDDVSKYMAQIREVFIANHPSGSAMQVTKVLCETFANDLIEAFNLPSEVGSESINDVSKAVSNIWFSSVAALK